MPLGGRSAFDRTGAKRRQSKARCFLHVKVPRVSPLTCGNSRPPGLLSESPAGLVWILLLHIPQSNILP